MCIPLLYFFFFFQAEDGIRYRNVTGVQTCALPIWSVKPEMSAPSWVCPRTALTSQALPTFPRSESGPGIPWRYARLSGLCREPVTRSEERRVVKGVRHDTSGWA